MRICLASIHPRRLSGQIDALVGLARELERLGHDVRVVTAWSAGRLADVDQPGLVERDGEALIAKFGRIGRTLWTIQKLAREVDLVHLNLPTPAFAVLGDLLQARVDVPVVVGFEAHLFAPRDGLRIRRLLAAPQFYLPRLFVNNHVIAAIARYRAAGYVVSSHYQRQELIAVGAPPDRIHVIPNLVDLGKLTTTRRVQNLGIPPWTRRVTYMGHYNDVKGVDLLVEAFPDVLASHPDARLVLAWSGLGPAAPIARAIRRAGIARAVVQLGRVDVGPFLAASDVVVLPYRLTIGQAAFPVALLEALQIGVPVVTTNLPLLAELLTDGVHAVLVPPESPRAIAAAINQLLDQEEWADAMRANQRRLFSERLRPSRLADAYIRLYRTTIGHEAPVLQPDRGRALV